MANVKLKSFVAARVRRCRTLMDEHGFDGLIVTDPADVRYLTGFSGDDSTLVLTNNRKVLVTDSRYVEQAKQECPSLPQKVRSGPMAQAVGEVLSKTTKAKSSSKKTPRIGIIADAVTVSQYKAYRKAIGRGLKDCPPIINKLRLCKDAWEVAQMRKAVRVAEKSLLQTLSLLKLGMSELDVKARLDYEMACNGSSEPAFGSIVAWGPHAAQPHAQPGKSRLRNDQSILFDWGATIGGYRSDLTRCYVAGKIRPVFADAYRWVLDAQLAAIQAVRPGMALNEVDAVARKALPKTLPAYGHGTGHGIGLSVHEAPSIAKVCKDQLREGMIVTIEPGVYLPGSFGIRIEDDVLVTAKGSTVLSKLDKTLDSVTLWE